MAIGTYDPLKVTTSIAGINIVGPFADGTFVKCTRNEAAFTLQMGADGKGTRTRNRNRSGKIEVTISYSSPSMATLSALAIADELDGSGVGAFLCKDNSGSGAPTVAEAGNVWVEKIPDMERAKESGWCTWTFETDELVIAHTGLTAA